MSTKSTETPTAEVKPVEDTTTVAVAPAVVAVAETPKATEAAVETATEAKAAEPVAAAVPAVEAKSEAKTEEATVAQPAKTKAVEAEAAPVAAEAPAEAAAAAPAAAAASAVVPAEEPKATPIQSLWALVQDHDHDEIWGVFLADPDTHIPSQIVLQKYLNANDGDLEKAKDQLLKTLDWRAKTKPLELLKKTYDSSKFGGLGYVTSYLATETYDPAVPESKEVFTWNVYGNVSSMDKTFGSLEDFINWRVALMELALQDLSLATATKAITATYDPYKIFQVHDYKSISFLRQSPLVKSASTETIKVFAQGYPELLKEKFFVNVPAIMGFVYAFMKLFVAAKTIKKFHPMSNGAGLVHEFGESQIKDLGKRLPKEYGGSAGELKTLGKETLLTAGDKSKKAEEPVKAEVKEEAKVEAKADATAEKKA